MTSLVSLPVELVTKIVSHVVPRRDLATLRLTCRTLKEIATPFYFNTVPIYPEWNEDEAPDPPFPNHIDYESRYMRNILDDEHLKKLVKKIQIYTCNPDCDHHPHWVHHAGNLHLYGGFMPQPSMSDDWEDVYNRIPEFPKLNSVSLIFDRHAADYDRKYSEEELQGPDERIAGVRQLLRLLGKRIEDLSIRHMQLDSWIGRRNQFQTDPEVLNDLELKNVVLAGLQALRMNVVHLQPHGESGPVYKVTNCHREWAEFPSFWLAPAVNLRHLTLYSDVPFGWFPKLDLRSVHFAQLETLALGQFIFGNDLPFEWITKHSGTLKELYLDHCSILYQYGATHRQHEWLDEEGYPITEPAPLYSSVYTYAREKIVSFGSYAKRWHEVFSHFSNTLGQLHTFRFGSSAQWKFDVVNRYDDGSPGMPVMPWDAERDLQNDIFPERYLVWDDFEDEYVTEWKKSTDKAVRNPKTWDEEDYKRFESYPDCTDEDKSALRELLNKIRMPNGDEIRVSDIKSKHHQYDDDYDDDDESET